MIHIIIDIMVIIMVNHWWFITPNIIYQRLPYDSRLVHLVHTVHGLHETGEGAREGLALGWMAFVEGSSYFCWGFSQNHPAIKGYPHLWKPLYVYIYIHNYIHIYIYIYISESQYGLGRLSRQNWIMESLCPLGDLKKSVPVISFRTFTASK